MRLSKRWLKQFFDNSDSDDVDHNRRLNSFLYFSYFGCIALSAFSYGSYSRGLTPIFLIVSLTALVFFINLVLFHVYKDLNYCCVIGCICIISFCLVLVYHGGVENTALYWVFPFPLVIFAILGYYHGAIANFINYVALLILLNSSEYLIANYDNSEVIRFLSSLFVINIISFINEYFREHSHSTMADINSNKNKEANTDALTHLPNRRFVDSVFFPACKMNVNERFPMVLIMADVDHFKSFNDNYEHLAGDLILEQLSRTMEECIRHEDIVARVGGEEFLFLFSHAQYKRGLKIAEKIRNEVELMEFKYEKQTLKVTVSFGVAVARNHSDIQNKLKEADVKLYQAKEDGRNCVC